MSTSGPRRPLHALLASRRHDILAAARRFGAARIRVFGSVARGQARPGSDVDFLVDFEPGRSLLDQAGLRLELEALLGCSVDIVVEGGISPYIEDRILAEARPICSTIAWFPHS